MSDFADPGPNTPTIESITRSTRRRFGGGWEAGKRVAFFGVLVLIMLVPLGMVEGVVDERAATKAQVAEEIGAQWGPAQTISGPVLVVPYEAPRVTLSIGLASWPTDGDDAAGVLARADARLYAAKRAGRNRLVAEGG